MLLVLVDRDFFGKVENFAIDFYSDEAALPELSKFLLVFTLSAANDGRQK
jgi:hypothetical protein